MVPKTIPWNRVKHHWEIYLFIIPTLVLIGLFQYYPAASGVYHSFFRWNGADISEFVGWENYGNLLKSTEFWESFKVAFLLGVWNVVKMVPAVLVAVCIHRCRSERMQYLYRIMFVVPMVVPALVVVLIWRSFFFEATNGYLNWFLVETGLFGFLGRIEAWLGVAPHEAVFAPGSSPAWLGDPRLILTACVVWGFPWVGSFAVLTHLAKLQSINKDIYEAGDIDGAGWWGKFLHIEMPLITSSIYILLVFTIIGTIRDAGIILALAGLEGGPGGRVTVPALFMIRKAFVDQQMGYACAVGIVLTLVVMGLQKLSEKYMGWELLRPRDRLVFRTTALGAAAALFWFERLVLLAVVLVLVSLPLAQLKPTALYRRWRSASPKARTLGRFVGLIAGTLLAGSALAELSNAPSLPEVRSLLGGLKAGLLLTHPWPGFLLWLGVVVLGCVAFSSPTVYQGYALPTRAVHTAVGVWRAAVESVQTRRMLRRLAADQIRLPTWSEQTQALLLRAGKHATIWAVLAFAFLPVYLMLIVSLKDNPQFYEAPAVLAAPYHWHNWRTAWEAVSPSVANSIFISTGSTVGTLVFALAGAYFFARVRVPMSALFWNAILVLMMMPTIANLVPLFRLLTTLNLLNTLTALILVGASAGQVFAIFVLRSFVADIPQDLFEAGDIDGASHYQQLRNIVVPLSGPILANVGIMQFITVWNDFVLPLIIMRDSARLPVMVQLLRMAGEYIKLWGPLMAGYALASLPVIVLFVFCMRLFVRGMTEGAIKS